MSSRALVTIMLMVSMAFVATWSMPISVYAVHISPPFTQCPPVGLDTSCGFLIVFNANGTSTVLQDPAMGPYDGVEDTLVGVQNNAGVSVPSVTISGPNIFGFEGDGLCNPGVGVTPAGCPFGPTGYEGPRTSFTVVDANSGTVVFTGGLGAGNSAYFSLEGTLNLSSFIITPIPEYPYGLVVLGIFMVVAYGVIKRRAITKQK